MFGKITEINTRYFKLPLEGNLVDAIHGKHNFFEIITAEVILDSGVKGVGYTYTGGIGGAAAAVMVEKDLKPFLLGREMEYPETMNALMGRAIHYVARGGIASFAISALDIAFWDIMLREKGMSLAEYWGTPCDRVRTYYGGIDLMLTEKELLEQTEKQLELGHTAVKIKLGKENGDEDIARVKAVRRLIGDKAAFMVDANMVWDEKTAVIMARRLEEFGITWLEEPTNPDDYEAYARIGQATSIPVGMGENLHTYYEHEMALRIGHIKCPIPDASNAGGITGFLQVANLAKGYHLEVNSHGMQELHTNILAGLDNRGYVEFHSFPIWQYTCRPLVVKDGWLEPASQPGIGVEFDWEKLEKMKQ